MFCLLCAGLLSTQRRKFVLLFAKPGGFTLCASLLGRQRELFILFPKSSSLILCAGMLGRQLFLGIKRSLFMFLLFAEGLHPFKFSFLPFFSKHHKLSVAQGNLMTGLPVIFTANGFIRCLSFCCVLRFPRLSFSHPCLVKNSRRIMVLFPGLV